MKIKTQAKKCGLSLMVGAALISAAASAVTPNFEPAVIAAPIVQASSMRAEGIIVKYKNSSMGIMSATESAAVEGNVLRRMGSQLGRHFVHKRVLATGASLIELDDDGMELDIEELAEMFEADENVEYAEPNAIMYRLLTPNDSRYGEQWHYFENTGGIRADLAWDKATGEGVVVAVIDTGSTPHPELVGNTLPGYDFISNSTTARDGGGRDNNPNDEGDWYNAGECGRSQPGNSSWHGTHVAGTIGAITNNSSGVAGVAFNAKLIHARVLGKCGGTLADIADAIIWSAGGSVSGVPANANPADVINMSLGGGGACGTTYQNAITQARNLGTTVVVAAGNESQNASNSRPANCSGVIAVASTTQQGDRSSFSNFGAVVDVAAPGSSILSTLNSGAQSQGSASYAFYNGTSMATPHTAGVAALLYQAKPSITPDEVESTLKSTARAFPGSCSQCGSGIINANAAVDAVSGTTPPPPPPGSNVLENGVAKTGLSASTGNDLNYTIDIPAGATDITFTMSGGTGDADLYVKFGSAPTDSSYDCRPYASGNSETCTGAETDGTYYVRIKAYSSFSGVSITASYTEASTPPPGGLTPIDVTVDNISVSRNQWKRYTLDLEAGYSDLVVSISGGSGDADLYVRHGAESTTSQWDCRPYKNGNNETCTFNTPDAGVWYIDIRGYSTSSGITLRVQANP